MSSQPPIPAELWDQIPPAAQAAILTLVQQYERIRSRAKGDTHTAKSGDSAAPA